MNDWRNNKEDILKLINQKFDSPLIIRSSAFGEDSLSSSKAGAFCSILNVSPNSNDQISIAIEYVIKSYEKSNNSNDKNKILSKVG